VKKPPQGWLEPLDRELLETQAQFQQLFDPNLFTWPIPFFGRLFDADVLTVGVNPSLGEFQNERWADVRNCAQAEDRLLNYFHSSIPLPHPWFKTWELALNEIEASYYGKSKYLAAHLDLSPRATKFMSEADRELFIEMVRNDLFSFIRFLNLAERVRFAFMAGTVTGDFYINHFLSEHLPEGAELRGSFSPGNQPGPAKVVFPRLITTKKELPVFFCSCSPSDRQNRDLLIDRVKVNAGPIRKLGKL
jgi:hypothetical protein